ncbi:MAG: adenosine deaminase family protein, partial [Terriglobales bacterium]
RQHGSGPFEQVVGCAIKLQQSRFVVGIGVGGDEAQCATAEFAPGFDRARAAGLHTTIHAGETRGPESVREALELLRPDRIGHGLRTIEDAALLDALAASGTCIDICAISNLKTGVWPGSAPHPAHEFYKRGVTLSVSTDDPGIFGSTLLDEYAYLHERGGFSLAELESLARGSFACSFMAEDERAAMAAPAHTQRL